MAKSNMDQDILKVLLSEEEIKARVQELGDRLYDRFKDKNPMFVGVLIGCFIFMADLVRAAQLRSEVGFIGLSSEVRDSTRDSRRAVFCPATRSLTSSRRMPSGARRFAASSRAVIAGLRAATAPICTG